MLQQSFTPADFMFGGYKGNTKIQSPIERRQWKKPKHKANFIAYSTKVFTQRKVGV